MDIEKVLHTVMGQFRDCERTTRVKTKDAKVESFSAVAKKRMKKQRRVGQTYMGSNLSMMTHP